MTMFATHAAGEVIDAIRPDLEAFTSLWTALRVNYEGTNITRTVARLLHMYQPEEGVIAYERLLRTLFVLLEDFDSDGLQLLVSMVPPPKGASDELVKEVFNRATGFVRVDAPIFHKNTYSQCMSASTSTTPAPTVEIPYPKSSNASQKPESVLTSEKLIPIEVSKTVIHSTAENDPCSGKKNRVRIKSPQINSQESGEVFRGFLPSEIHNTQSHVQSMKNFYRPPSNCGYAFPSTSGQSFVNFGQIVGQNSGRMQHHQSIGAGVPVPGYRPKWFQAPYLIQKNSYPMPQYHDLYLKTVNNQFVKIPAEKLQKNFRRVDVPLSRAPYQQPICDPANNFLNNRSNTVTSGLLEKVQQRWRLSDNPAKTGNESLKLPGVSEGNGSEPKVACGVSEGEKETSEGNSASAKKKLTTFIEINDDNNNNNNNINNDNNFKGGNVIVKKKMNPDNRDTPSVAITNRSSFGGDGNREGEKLTAFRNDFISSETSNVSINREAFEDFTKEVRMRQRAIQEDIYKMDVVRCNGFADEEPRCGELDDANSIKPEILTASEELRTSLKGFLERVRTGETVAVPTLPRTRSLSAINEERGANRPSDSNLWRLLTLKNRKSESNTPKNSHSSRSPPDFLSKNPTAEDSPAVNNFSAEIPMQVTNEYDPASVLVPLKRPVQRRKKAETLLNDNQKAFPNDRIRDLPDESINLGSMIAANPDTDARNNSHQESPRRCPQRFSASQTASCSSVGQVTTMAELAAYKKQYYDALLSIQKAKAAVANSLAISSVGTPAGFDPYYYNYVQHHRHQMLHRHHRQMIVGQRFPQQQSLPPSSSWFRAADWRYPLIETSRLPQRPQMLHPSSSLWPPRVGFLARDSQASGVQRDLQPNVPQQSKPHMKRRKLEEIVGKLKESETNGGNN